MVISTSQSTTVSQPLTLQEYLEFDDGIDRIYELIDGIPIAMPTESNLNTRIAFLFAYCFQLGIPTFPASLFRAIAI